MTAAEMLKKHSIELMDITQAIRKMPERQSLLKFDEPGVRPVYAKRILKLLLLMEWPVFNGEVTSWMRFYAAVLQHGKTHVAEVYLMQGSEDQSQPGKYLGTFRVYSINLPDPAVLEKDEDIGSFISDFLAGDLGLQVEA